MIRYFAVHPTAANILMVVIILMGLATLPSLNRETFPDIVNRNVQVTVPYPGAGPLEVEEGVCNPLEDATDGINYLREQKCIAKDNTAIFTVEMDESGNMDMFINDIKSAVDAITNFPVDVENPVVEQLGRTQAVVSVAVASELNRSELKQLAEYYRTRLLQLPEVKIVDINGFSTHEFKISVKPEVLAQYSLSIEDIAHLIRQQSIDLPAGAIKSHHKTYQIRFENARRTIYELENLVIAYSDLGGQIRLGDIASVSDQFENEELRTEVNGSPAAILVVRKNASDDTLKVFDAVKTFVNKENAHLPESTQLILTQDTASIVKDRLVLLLRNGWQGLALASLTLMLFFNWRYTFWVSLGLPLSFVGGLVIMSFLGITINMISLVALLMAIGILMDDAIVISESVASEYKKISSPLEAAVQGVNRVKHGIICSFSTSALLFGSLLFLDGDMGQIMRVLPIVLLAVLSISLVEAFLILPHHLMHSLQYQNHTTSSDKNIWRNKFETIFDALRHKVGCMAGWSIRYRYFVVGVAIGLLIISFSFIPSGVLKFKFFPDLEGNVLEARVLLPQGTPFHKTESVVDNILDSLQAALSELPDEPDGKLVKNIKIAFSKNLDSGQEGGHLATITLDLLESEKRINSLNTLRRIWSEKFTPDPELISVQFKEPTIGPAGRAIAIRLQGDDLDELSVASWKLQQWLSAYEGVSNIMDDLRPGKAQLTVNLLPGALNSGVNAESLSSQLRAAYQGIKVGDVYQGREAYEIRVSLHEDSDFVLSDLESFPIFNTQKDHIPLMTVASLEQEREYSKVTRIKHIRTVLITGDIDDSLANTNEIISDTKGRFLDQLGRDHPDINISLEGEVKNSQETNRSIMISFIMGIIGVYLLLSLQLKNYREPVIIMINIPLAAIGVIWGHIVMGLDLTMPSLIGFVSLSGIVVNDSILLVEFVKYRVQEGLNLHMAVIQAVRDRFRAIFLTSITTIAGMLPLLSETSLQAQVLVPLITSVVFGMISSTILILIVLPSTYAILKDFNSILYGTDKSNFSN